SAEKAKEAIEKAKRSLGELLHVSDAEVIFTSGGTEANNWVIYSAIQSFKSISEHSATIPHVITSTIEHPSVLEPLPSSSGHRLHRCVTMNSSS
ncbi:hypothetical protein COOONC_22543, partial [Cooperia oncophora]